MFPAEQLNLYRELNAHLLGAMPQVNDTKDTLYNKAYAALFPIVCSKDDIGQYSRALKQSKELMPALGRVLRNRRQGSEWCLNMEELHDKVC